MYIINSNDLMTTTRTTRCAAQLEMINQAESLKTCGWSLESWVGDVATFRRGAHQCFLKIEAPTQA